MSVSTVFADCKKCSANTRHRQVNDKRPGRKSYLACSICLENNSKRHRKLHWTRYLAQKANVRKVPGSIKLTGDMIEALNLQQNSKCLLTGTIFDIDSKWYRPSIDRIDSNKGYTLDNIRLVAWIVNHSRGSLTDQEFFDMCNKVTRNNI